VFTAKETTRTAEAPAPAKANGRTRSIVMRPRSHSMSEGRIASPERIMAITSSSKCELVSTMGSAPQRSNEALSSRIEAVQRRQESKCDSRKRRSFWFSSSSRNAEKRDSADRQFIHPPG
jgi:hypothetical protein